MKSIDKPITEGRHPGQAADEAVATPAASTPKKDISTLANPKCKKCHGTGRLGWVMEKGVRKILACQCVKERVFTEALKYAKLEHERKQKLSKEKPCQNSE